RAYTGSERVAWIDRIVRDAAPLNAIAGAPRSCRKCLAGFEAIFVGVGIDQAADGPVFGGYLGLNTAPGAAVLGNDNGAFNRDAEARQLFVIFGNPVVHKDERTGNVTVNRIRVVGGKLLVLLLGSGIQSDGWLLQLGSELWAAFD